MLLLLGTVTTVPPSNPAVQEQVHQGAVAKSNPRCTSTPCGNTASGEDPQDVRIREGMQMRARIAGSASDQARWKIPIFSDAKDPKDLELDLVKTADFKLRLMPQQGRLEFLKAGTSEVFEIGPAANSNNLMCRRYALRVIDASVDHAMIQKSCSLSEYRPGRFHKSTAYYLYDAPTHTMRLVWDSFASEKDAPSTAPSEKPNVLIVPNGYEIRMGGTYIFEGETIKLSLRNAYLRQPTANGKMELVCSDLLQPKAERIEAASCEGGILPLVSTETNLTQEVSMQRLLSK